MKPLARTELEELMQRRDGVCVSLFAPMVKAGAETQQNPIRCKNLVRRAHDALAERRVPEAEARELLAPAVELIDDMPFWQHQSTGLALFLSPGFFRYYRLPLELRELAVVEDRFHLKPLLPLLSGDGRFHILALSQNRARLLEATRHSVRELDLGDLPTSLNEAVGYQLEETHIQYHSGARTARGTGSPVYHGQGGGEDDVKLEIQKFFNLLDHGIASRIVDKEVPLVLAGVEFLFPLYRQVTSLPNVVDGGVPGNHDATSAHELLEKAWPWVEPHFTQAQEQAEGRFHELLGTGQASGQFDDVVMAAHDGRVETLFVALGTRRWGSFDEERRAVALAEDNAPGTEDLVDFAALQTLRKGGRVFAVQPEQVPDGGAVAAVYRY